MSSTNFSKAIVRTPGRSIINGVTTSSAGKPDYKKALEQHQHYIKTLEKCNLQVTVMEPEEEFPDSTFVEDTAVLAEKCAIITNLGIDCRKGEQVSLDSQLQKFYKNILYIKDPGTLEGGDIMRVEDHFYIGLSSRTNNEGAQQFIAFLKEYGYTGSTVSLKEMLHLKSGVAYLGDNTLVVAGEFTTNSAFKDFKRIGIDVDESYAANCIRVNEYVIMPSVYAKTRNALIKAGFCVVETDVSEFRKIDGGVSCLSLRF